MLLALTRAVSPRIGECELTFADRQPIDPAIAAEEHEAYERLLVDHGCEIVHADPAPAYPDGVFVEDAAIVLDEVAVITRPGADSRRNEVESIARALEPYRALQSIIAPATIDGGDVLRAGRKLYVGLSQRTNDAAVAQLRAILDPFDYEVIATPFRGCLHLKSAVTQLDGRTLLCNPDWIDPIAGFDMIAVDPSEPVAANVLRLGDTVIMAAEHPRTREILEQRGYRTAVVRVGELMKAEAGVTCCSVIFVGA